MDVLLDDVAALDGPLLAALWTRAVLAGDPWRIAQCEIEAESRGTTARALVAAAKKKSDDEDEMVQVVGKRREGPHSQQDIVTQTLKNRAEGKNYDTGQASYQTKGYNPYRKKKGEKGGGQFTSKNDSAAETTDPEVARKKLQEDDPSIPDKSPGGADIEDFRDGMMIYEDGTRFDGEGWRNAKGQALDAKGNVIKKAKAGKGGKSAVDRAKEKAARDAEKAAKTKEREESRAWDTAESRRAANEKADKGDYGALLSILERNERDARKQRDLDQEVPFDKNRMKDFHDGKWFDADGKVVGYAASEDGPIRRQGTDKAALDKAVADAQKELADAKAKAAEAKTGKDAKAKTDREAKSAEAKKERETKAETARTAEYAEIAKNYPAWESALRERYADVGLTEAELADLIIRDRARRVRALPRRRPVPTAAAALLAAYDPALHPKGKDGKWIEKLGLVDVFGLSGFQHGQRGQKQVQGQVTEIVPNTKDPGDPIIRIKVTDPRWDPAKFGATVDVKRSQVAQRQKVKANLPKVAPKVDIAQPKIAPSDTGVIPPRTPLPGMPADKDGPNFAPLTPPGDWAQMDSQARLDWLQDRMNTDLSAWRGEPTTFDFTGFDPGIAFNMANTYRDLANWDPDTARRIDQGVIPSVAGSNGLGANAIAVAHPGTAHPGGIGPKVKPSAIVFGVKYVADMKFYEGQKAKTKGAAVPFSTSGLAGDPTITLVHEFGHHRQFRYLDIAMRDAGKAWSPTVRDDGFGLVPDSSNWPETQALRYQIPKLSQTEYGQSKSSEGFAEGIAERSMGISSPALNDTFDKWDALMGVSLGLPADRHAQSRSFDELTATEKDQFWQANGPYLDLPGMRDHFPDSAAEYDLWVQLHPGKQEGFDTEAFAKLKQAPQNQATAEVLL